MSFDATPQEFAFGDQKLMGELLSFNGQSQRRHVVHEFPKRAGGLVEDQGAAPRRVTVRLVFLGPTCAADYDTFKRSVAKTPTATLVHPIAGKFTAFCLGPDESVDFSRAIDAIEVNCSFVESALDSTLDTDTPDVATSAQLVTNQLATTKQAVATAMGAFAKAATKVTSTLNAIDAAIKNVASYADPPVSVLQVITAGQGLAGTIIKVLQTVQLDTTTLGNDIESLISACNDTSTGSTVAAGGTDSINSLMATVLEDTEALMASLIAASPTPAGAAIAAANVQFSADTCLTLVDAVNAARPPTIQVTVPRLMGLVRFAAFVVDTYGLSIDPQDLASIILGLNRIPTPSAIPAGTLLDVPSQ